MAASLDDLATNGKLINSSIAALNQTIKTLFPRVTGTFTLAAASTTTVAQPLTQANSVIILTPTNAAAATLQGSNKALYLSARTAGASFTVATASAAAAAGTETFQYSMWAPV